MLFFGIGKFSLLLTVPDELCCPISLEIMRDPVIAADGMSYERARIADWLQHKHTSPLTNDLLPSKSVIPNIALAQVIRSYLLREQEVAKYLGISLTELQGGKRLSEKLVAAYKLSPSQKWSLATDQPETTDAALIAAATALEVIDSRRAVIASPDRKIHICDMDTGSCALTLAGTHASPARALRLLPKNKLVSVASDKCIRVWDLATRACVKTFQDDAPVIYCLEAISSEQFATGSDDAMIKVWSLGSIDYERMLFGHMQSVNVLRLASTRTLASGSSDNTVKLWDLDSNECVHTLTGHTSAVRSLELVAGAKLASGAQDATIKLWNLANGELLRTLTGHTGHVNALVLLANGQLVSGSSDRSIRVWNVDEGTCFKKMTAGDEVTMLKIILN